MARELPPTLAEATQRVHGRVKSVLVIDNGEVPPSVYESLEQDGWICGHARDVASAVAMLHEVRPALVLVRSNEQSRTLREDPLLAGLSLVVLDEDAGEPGALAARLDALV
jgi:hypothetical protein